MTKKGFQKLDCVQTKCGELVQTCRVAEQGQRHFANITPKLLLQVLLEVFPLFKTKYVISQIILYVPHSIA